MHGEHTRLFEARESDCQAGRTANCMWPWQSWQHACSGTSDTRSAVKMTTLSLCRLSNTNRTACAESASSGTLHTCEQALLHEIKPSGLEKSCKYSGLQQ